MIITILLMLSLFLPSFGFIHSLLCKNDFIYHKKEKAEGKLGTFHCNENWEINLRYYT